MTYDLDLQIDHLVLEGVSASERSRVVAALEEELQKRLGESGGLADGERTVHLDGGSFTVPAGLDSRGIGKALGGAIHGYCAPASAPAPPGAGSGETPRRSEP